MFQQKGSEAQIQQVTVGIRTWKVAASSTACTVNPSATQAQRLLVLQPLLIPNVSLTPSRRVEHCSLRWHVVRKKICGSEKGLVSYCLSTKSHVDKSCTKMTALRRRFRWCKKERWTGAGQRINPRKALYRQERRRKQPTQTRANQGASHFIDSTFHQ